MIAFDNTYTSLPGKFYVRVRPEQVTHPQLFAFNDELARELGMDLSSISDEKRAALFTGQALPEGASSISLAYAGNQFGQFNPQLGDGRALLLGEVKAPDGQRYDIQLKGSGTTPWSRGGDGKSWVGPVIREYILSEAMHHLGVPTTRALAAATTGDPVYRESALPGGILTRVASSHIRIGTFEFFAARRDVESLRLLADYSIERHYPQCNQAANPYLAFLEAVGRKHAALVAKWMSLGFIHGVMNTDNMSISGETIDYGPCAFMDTFSDDKVFSSIDRGGRYAYGNQLRIAQWNLAQLANCLVPLVDPDINSSVEKLQECMSQLMGAYDEEWLGAMAAKFGIFEPGNEDAKIVQAFLSYLEGEKLDFTIEFRRLIGDDGINSRDDSQVSDDFRRMWHQRLEKQAHSLEQARERMRQSNPVYIPRNHQVERAIQSGVVGDYSVFERMNECLKAPFERREEFAEFERPPEPGEVVRATFCGT
ncbi:MAG TPA: YdiU family protein [Leptospiraceae bacterium]|nr:hypothetical protein [Spirochaetaceae bacterium]HBS03985.1 YdiU family protein [Leptospiraceae bacterium]|tara:strand:+ start:567 stop:2009 length:1443 start_codon:yes stop_codon:yes gene_type:complete